MKPLALLFLFAATTVVAAEPLEDRVAVLLEGLGSPEAAERREAEDGLLELAKEQPARQVLIALPELDPGMPATVRDALERARLRITRLVAQASVAPSRVTLDAKRAPLTEVLADFEKQTGNRFLDRREAFGGEADPRPVTLKLDDEPFWPALFALLKAAKLDLYPYGEEGALTLIDGDGGAPPEETFTVAGPLAIAAQSVVATRGLSEPDESRLDLNLRVGWEPRLKPIAVSLPMTRVVVTTPGGEPVPPRTPEQSIDLEATRGEQAVEMTLSFVSPPRDTERLDAVSGELIALVPGATHAFRVEKLGEAQRITQRFGDAAVTFQRFVDQGSIWELHMRVRIDNVGDALASHRGWVFENPSYLLTPDGRRIEQAGFETTMQRDDEIGLAYLFDLTAGEVDENGFPIAADEDAEPVDPKTLTWVYETPCAVYTVPVKWELGPIELP